MDPLLSTAIADLLPKECKCCPHKNVDLDDHTNEHEVLRYLATVVEDEESSLLAKRNVLLAYHYLGLWKNEMNIIDLPYMSTCLEFFAKHIKEQDEYREILIGLFGKCQRPILLNKSSDLFQDKNPFPSLFSSLGRCLVLLEGESGLQLLALEAVGRVVWSERKSPREMGLEVVMAALERSSLLEGMLEAAPPAQTILYRDILRLLYSMSAHWTRLGELLMSLGYLDVMLSKLNFNKDLRPIEMEIKTLTSELIWLMFTQKPKENQRETLEIAKIPDLSQEAASCLKRWFRRDILHGLEDERTTIAALMLKTILFYPNMELSKKQFMDDIMLVSTAAEFGTCGTWAEGMRSHSPQSEMRLKKILMTIICLKFNTAVTQELAKEKGFLGMLSQLLDLGADSPWSEEPRREVVMYALQVLPTAAAALPALYSTSGATSRILHLIEYYSEGLRNLKMVRLCCECLHFLISIEEIRPHFIKSSVGITIINLAKMLLTTTRLTLLVQNILVHSCHILGSLGHADLMLVKKYRYDLCNLAIMILMRLKAPNKTDSKIENSLLIAAGHLVWYCAVLYPHTRKSFITENGIYMILDISEDAIFPVQFYFLNLLCECCLDSKSISQMVTWRGKKANTNVLSFLCQVWREQEKRKKVLRDGKGCIEDIECPLKGKIQRRIVINTFSKIPGLVEMVGCARTKIASIVYLITKTYHAKAQLAKSMYMVPYDTLSREDQITLEIIKYYENLKEGEMFWELESAINSTHTQARLTPLDTTMVHNLVIRHIGIANCIRGNQIAILQSEQSVLKQEELKLYDDIRESEMMKTLELAAAFKNNLRMSDFTFRETLQRERKEALNKIYNSISPEKENYHNTFLNQMNYKIL